MYRNINILLILLMIAMILSMTLMIIIIKNGDGKDTDIIVKTEETNNAIKTSNGHNQKSVIAVEEAKYAKRAMVKVI